MDPVIVISVICGIIILLLAAGSAGKPLRWAGQAAMKLIIGALFLFFLNALGNRFGIYVPINLTTSAVSGFLGLPGVAALAALQLWVLG